LLIAYEESLVAASEDIGRVFFEEFVSNAVYALEIIITIIILVIVSITLLSLFKVTILSLRKRDERIRSRISQIVPRMLRGLLISLDFLVAADILMTILDPSATELAKLVVIVAVRVLLSFSLSKEMKEYSD
jgi:uncharacterized membrane protein